jgi:hypothetical protein
MTKRWLDDLNAAEWNEVDEGFDKHLHHMAYDEEPEPEELPDSPLDLIQFREEEIGGAYDGFNVYSDADPGL